MPQARDILFVQNDRQTVSSAHEALGKSGLPHVLHISSSGADAYAFLNRSGKYAHAPRPQLILLDVDQPNNNGLEVLAELKKEPSLASIPVVVLSDSQQAEQICKAYGLGANSYIAKPTDQESFCQLFQTLDHFWFRISTLCSGEHA
tara:strand:- start:100 stop:540 length:441 start_codon:yes stop_codon:yes gene_type:complete